MKSTRASVVVPTSGQSPYLQGALERLIAQSPRFNFEIVVVQNGVGNHSDSTSRMVYELQKSALCKLVLVEEPRLGLHNARHRGAKCASGEVLVYVDDDSVAPPNWLEKILLPFEDPRVAAVGGKTVPLFAESPPSWLLETAASYLSILDLGGGEFAMSAPRSPFGCNMAVRKSLLYRYKGFHPDGFVDPRLRWLRGDGESALASKLMEDGWLVWYSSSAWLYHRVPASRTRTAYLANRAFSQGVSESFCLFRQNPVALPTLMRKAMLVTGELWLRRAYVLLARRPDLRLGRILAAKVSEGRLSHMLRLAIDPNLRCHVLQEHYMD